MALLVDERFDLLTEDRKINCKLLVKVSHWSFAETTFAKQNMLLVVENFAQNGPLYPESALGRGRKQTEGKADYTSTLPSLLKSATKAD